MGKVFASCGHEVFDDEITCTWKDMTREGGYCVAYGALCPSCYNEYVKMDLLLLTDEERESYMKDGKDEKEYVSVTLDIDSPTLDFLNRVAKSTNTTIDTVAGVMLAVQLDNESIKRKVNKKQLLVETKQGESKE